jgi:hypothetical protein
MPRLRLKLIDIISAVGSASLALALIHWAAPGRTEPALIVVGPLLGILWDRGRGGRGILGGTVGGVAHAGFCLLYFFTGPHGSGSASPLTMANWPVPMVYMTSVCVAFGTLMGLIAWLGAALTGQGRNGTGAERPVVLSP